MALYALLKKTAVLLLGVAAGLIAANGEVVAQARTALVIGQGGYDRAALPTAVNDAGLVAQALTGAGFEVIQGRDLIGVDMRRIVRDFLDKVEAGGPDGEVMVYLSGHGVQLEGENYLIPVDARIGRDSDIPIEGFRLSDLMRSLAGAPARTRIVVADLAHEYPLPASAQGIAQGLALVDPIPGFLIAFSSAPNLPAAEAQGPYGPYASALVEMIREPGLPLDEVFDRVRLRTHEETNGQQVPWHVADLKADFTFLELDASAAAPGPAPEARAQRRSAGARPEEAYAVAIERDTIEDYQEFLRRNPDHPEARRVSAMLAARREAVVWRKTFSRNTPNAYWTYLKIYPRGPHAPDARRRLARLRAELAPPVVFEEIVYEDLPPPLTIVETIEVVEVVTIIRRLPPPPPPPVYFLPPRDEIVVVIISRPPPPPPFVGILPIPVAIPLPMHARRPRWYQPIAPITPRGPVFIPVAAPERMSREEFRERRSRDRDRPFAPFQPREAAVPNQPGLAAPIVPIRVRAPEQDRNRAERDGNRRGRDAERDRNADRERGPRLPRQPLLLGERPTEVERPGAGDPTVPAGRAGRQDGPNRERRDLQDRGRGDGTADRERRPRDVEDRRQTGAPVPAETPVPAERLGRPGQLPEERRAREEQGRDRNLLGEAERQRGRALQQELQERRARDEAERQQGRALERSRAAEEQVLERRRNLEQQQRRAGEEQERQQRRGLEQQQRRAGEEQERQERRGIEQQQQRALEQQQRRAGEEQERQQRRALEQQQRRAGEEQERQQRRAIEQQQRAIEQQQQRRAGEEQERQQRRAIEQQQQRAQEQQQRAIEQQQQRRAGEEQERQQRRAIEQQQRAQEQQQQRAQERAQEQQQRAQEQQQRAQQRAQEEQQRRSSGGGDQGRGGGREDGARGDGGGRGGGRRSLECQLTGRC